MLKNVLNYIFLLLITVFSIGSMYLEEGEKSDSSLIQAIKNKDIEKIMSLIKLNIHVTKEQKNEIDDIIDFHINDRSLANAIRFDLGIGFHEQGLLQKKIVQYLEKEKEKSTNEEDVKNRNEVINYFNSSRGECVGLSVLWTYGKRMTEDALISKTTKPIDDIVFFNNVFKMLALWDEKQEFEQKQKADIERFIANLVLYQNPAYLIFNKGKGQLDLSLILEDTKQNHPIKILEESIVCTQQLLESRLVKIIHPKTLIFIGSLQDKSRHLMAIYQNSDKKIYFYDPNSYSGEILIKDYYQLMEAIWDGLNSSNFSSGFGGMSVFDIFFRDLKITIFKFSDDVLDSFPSAKELSMTEEEFMTTLKEQPELFELSISNIKDFINQLSESQTILVLENSAISPKIKTLVIRSLFEKSTSVDHPQKLLSITSDFGKYLYLNHTDILKELLAHNILNFSHIDNLIKLAKKTNTKDILCLKYLNDILSVLANNH